jgi:hypothetical protein
MSRLPDTVIAILQRANIVLYPVEVHGGGLAALESESATRELGTPSVAGHSSMPRTSIEIPAERRRYRLFQFGGFP